MVAPVLKPKTKYAKSGRVSIAYQVFGAGPIDLVYVPGWVSDVELHWDDPPYARFLTRLGAFARVITFDKRGTGLSDRDVGYPALEERMDDVRAVMDAASSQRAVIFGMSEGGSMSMLFAATYPERTRALVLFGAFAKRTQSADYPWAPAPAERQAWFDAIENNWNDMTDVADIAPSRIGDRAFEEWVGTLQRRGASPSAALTLAKTNTEIDVRGILPSIRVPTLIMQRRGDRDVKVDEARYLAEHIAGAKLKEFEGADHLIWCGDTDSAVAELQEFVTGARPPPDIDRVLATILVTDIVGSTERAVAMADRAWRDLLERHHALVRAELARHRGHEINTAGDSFMVAFDGPARAVRCARAIHAALEEIGLRVRAGLHTGECEVANGTYSGIALHIGARIGALAGAGETLVSRTVRDLCVGSGIEFATAGEHILKGVPGNWDVFLVRG